MGTWGAGNLDSDTGRDELRERTDELVKSIMDTARLKSSRAADEYDHDVLFVEFEILFALHEKDLFTTGEDIPAEQEIEDLMQDYIKDWDAYIDGLEPTADHKRERRRVILETFDRFKQICQEFRDR